ncbi:MAG: transcription termination/antitermination factor NusG [Treponema sp.]|nr:transcription termination/antitermination factor NusG [Treponema sp.]MBQ2552407.1 transcription termination/antitermination factor NusG [Treponema sp.]MBQ5383158.1 transcription termination/antitermination factor NusG [Treponema sp.]
MAKSWYIVQVFTGYEQKIESTLKRLLANGELDSNVLTEVKVPVETVLEETKNNKIRERKNKILPGYVMVEMDLPELGWKSTCNAIRRIQGVNGFVGTSPTERPRPISTEEAKRVFQLTGELKGEKKTKSKQTFEIGDRVKITEGPFATCDGTVEEISNDLTKLKVGVEVFGRMTPVEVDCTSVAKI